MQHESWLLTGTLIDFPPIDGKPFSAFEPSTGWRNADRDEHSRALNRTLCRRTQQVRREAPLWGGGHCCHWGGQRSGFGSDRSGPPRCEDQSETRLILLLVAARQSIIGAASTSIITVAMFRSEIMPKKKIKAFNRGKRSFSVNKATDARRLSNKLALRHAVNLRVTPPHPQPLSFRRF